MSELVEHITDARNNGTINVYAVRYNQREKTDNVAVALPGNLNFDFRHDFCENIIQYEDAQEVAFNPTSNGLEDGTYEYEHDRNRAEACQQCHQCLYRSHQKVGCAVYFKSIFR